MRAEILAVGTELLLGQIANTNAQRVSEVLAEVGVDVLFHTTVGDNRERIATCITDAMNRCDVVIITGGLGPTHDDLTREAISDATGRALLRDESLETWLKERFAAFGRAMPESNLRQADVPEGASTIPNPRGTAPGIFIEHEGATIIAVPGVPSEMELMLTDHILPRLRTATGEVIVSRILKTTGDGESAVAKRIATVIDDLERERSATIALLASPGEVRIRISAKAPDEGSASASIAPVEQRLREILGPLIFGVDDDTLESVVGAMLLDHDKTIAIAESFTAGILSSRLARVPGISKSLKAGYVTYSNEAKSRDLGIDRDVIEQHGAVSEQTARAMAEGARETAGADIGLATTGEAGPEPSEAPVGTMFLAVSDANRTEVRSFVAPGSREAIRQWGAQGALNLLRLFLAGDL